MIANTKLKPRGYRTPLSCFDPYWSVGPDKLVRLQAKSELSIMVKQLDKAVNGQQLWRLLNDAKFRSQKNLILVCNPCGPEAAHNHYTTPQAAKRHFFDHPMEAPLPAVPEIPLHLMVLALEKDWPMEIDWDEEAEVFKEFTVPMLQKMIGAPDSGQEQFSLSAIQLASILNRASPSTDHQEEASTRM
ncbi:hypothetical protein CF326_g6549 [Tilletia indica]|uniref:Uncharacterized protein n=1 Tax=Tilletia indica TaxID=43049 RepID=A0A177T8G6_9BASI|nr:hypothetical protein CF326_g6549 [Tilletia indica]KAE8240130.1 hypothetical protein A4X13_0g7928 [Tilletia indica]